MQRAISRPKRLVYLDLLFLAPWCRLYCGRYLRRSAQHTPMSRLRSRRALNWWLSQRRASTPGFGSGSSLHRTWSRSDSRRPFASSWWPARAISFGPNDHEYLRTWQRMPASGCAVPMGRWLIGVYRTATNQSISKFRVPSSCTTIQACSTPRSRALRWRRYPSRLQRNTWQPADSKRCLANMQPPRSGSFYTFRIEDNSHPSCGPSSSTRVRWREHVWNVDHQPDVDNREGNIQRWSNMRARHAQLSLQDAGRASHSPDAANPAWSVWPAMSCDSLRDGLRMRDGT